MPNHPPDFVPPPPAVRTGLGTDPADANARPQTGRGGPRPGAGAKPGNLNALKHGRYSRFAGVSGAAPPQRKVGSVSTPPASNNSLPLPPLDPNAVARRVLRGEQRAVERIAASLLRVVLDARHDRDVAEAVAAGRPLPPPPLVTGTEQDLRRVVRYMATISDQLAVERAHAQGRIPSDLKPLQHARRFAATVERLLPILGPALDRAARPDLALPALAAILPRNEHGNDQSPQIPLPSPLNLRKERKKRRIDQTAPPSRPTGRTPPTHKRHMESPDSAPLSRNAGEGPGEGADAT